jgi:hypothetical protein
MRTIIESPFAGNIERNRMYARLSMNIALTEYDESPLAFHTIYTQALSDSDPIHRKMGIEKSFPWYEVADKIVYMVDRGISTGMHDGFSEAQRIGRDVEFRTASTNPELIKEVRRWKDIDEADAALKNMVFQSVDLGEIHYKANGDITPFARERVTEIKLIEAVNSAEFKSHKRDRSESILSL